MKYQVLLSLKNNENIFKTVVCSSHDWHLKGKGLYFFRINTYSGAVIILYMYFVFR